MLVQYKNPLGTGKSFLIDVKVRQLKASYQLDPHDIAVVVMAPTGLAAFNVNGCTIHKFL